jgi:D-alanyl-D-alanine carboxypeptidase/D-alanyl-D-alanine-endopeptidase (penicillin-binding protein 4)
LGADYRFTTSFYTNDIDYSEGTLDGDLIIVGGGDPLISGRFQDSLTVLLQYWANSLIDLGIEKINGDIVVDNNFFEPDEIGPGWSYDYLSYWYACPVSALSFNDNCVDFHAYPVRNLGDACQIVFSPPTDYIAITNNSVTLPAGVDNTFDYVRQVGTNNVEFFGGIAVDDTSGLIDYVTVDKPDIYCAQIFRNVLKLNNIKVKGEIVEIGRDSLPEKYQYRNLVKLFDWQSEPMSVVIKVINKNSQNFFAEEALKTIGAEYVAEGSFPMSTRIVRDWLEAIGISRDEVSYYDGSGLSHMNLATPFSIIQLLQYMYESDDFETYYESMAIPGVDRSVRGRMAAEPMASLMRTKTGSIANTRTFSGYLTTSSGRLMAFSMMINNYAATRDEIDDWTDGFCSYIINTR